MPIHDTSSYLRDVSSSPYSYKSHFDDVVYEEDIINNVSLLDESLLRSRTRFSGAQARIQISDLYTCTSGKSMRLNVEQILELEGPTLRMKTYYGTLHFRYDR